MTFRWLFVFANNYISTNVYGHFESFRFFNQKITLVEGLECTAGTVQLLKFIAEHVSRLKR